MEEKRKRSALPLKVAIEEFSAALQVAANSKKMYRGDLLSFAAHQEHLLGPSPRVDSITPEALRKYLGQLARVGYRSSSIVRRASVLRSFFKWVYGSESTAWVNALKVDELSWGISSSAVAGESELDFFRHRALMSQQLSRLQHLAVARERYSPEMALFALYWESGRPFHTVVRLRISEIADGVFPAIKFRNLVVIPGWEWWSLLRWFRGEREKGGGNFLFLSDAEGEKILSTSGRSRRWVRRYAAWLRQEMQNLYDTSLDMRWVRRIRQVRQLEAGEWVFQGRQLLSNVLLEQRMDLPGKIWAAFSAVFFSGYPEMALRATEWTMEDYPRWGCMVFRCVSRNADQDVESFAFIPYDWLKRMGIQQGGIDEELLWLLSERKWVSEILSYPQLPDGIKRVLLRAI